MPEAEKSPLPTLERGVVEGIAGAVGKQLLEQAKKELEKSGIMQKLIGRVVSFITGLFRREQRKAELPAVHPARHEMKDPLDEDINDPSEARKGLARIDLAILRVVLSAKRFPEKDAAGELSYIPEPGTPIPYQSKVTFEGLLFDGTGAGIRVPGDSPHAWKTVFHLRGPDGQVATIGPGQDAESHTSDTDQIGAGGKNYVDSKGMIATFRVVAEGTYEAWATQGDVVSNRITFEVS